METKQYLSQISRLDRMIKNKISEISQLRELLMSVSAVSVDEKVQTSPNFDKIGSSFCKISEMEDNLNLLIDEYVKKKNEIIRLTVPNAVNERVPPYVLSVAFVIRANKELAPFLAKAENPTLIIERVTLRLGIKNRRSILTILR